MLLTNNIWRLDVLQYISGFVAKKILESLDCPECAASLYQNSDSSGDHAYRGHPSLLSCKRYGNLLVPSWSVTRVVQCVDKVARRALCTWSSISKETNIRITSEVLNETRNTTFTSLTDHSRENHILDDSLRDDHITILIKLIVKFYLTLFYHQFGRIFTERIIKDSKVSRRHKLTKQILFHNE